MRIISGKYKGRKIEGYDINGTRPTMDRVKESFISMIQDRIDGSICLDLFTGSGSVGFELISNGAKKCFFVDNNYKVIQTLNKNINNIKLNDDYELIHSDYSKALVDFYKRRIKFDIIFLDPPYKMNLINCAIEKILEYDLLADNGLIVCEYELEDINCQQLKIYKEKKYGSKNVRIYIK